MVLPEIYVSTDVETDGPTPGKYSMLSIGAAAFDATGNLTETFTTNLKALPGATTYPETMRWWKTQPDAWAACRRDPEDPESAMTAYDKWVRALPGKPVFVAYPAASDFLFVQWYLFEFLGKSPFGHNALDMRSYAMAVLKQPFYQSGKQNLPPEWFDQVPLNHIALDDAISQGRWFCKMLEANLRTPSQHNK